MNTTKLAVRAALGLTLTLAALTPAYAGTDAGPSEPSKQANIGALTGLAIGAAAGGPVGAVVGLTAGVIVGDHYHREQKAKAAMNADLTQSEAERARLSQNVTQLDASLQATQSQNRQLDATLKQAHTLGMDVSFRTDDDTIPEQALSPLERIGALAAAMPQTVVHIDGYADPRGSQSYNDALSLRRAQGVAALLTSAGVPAGRIVVAAHGKSQAQSSEGDLDGYALERRVSVRLEEQGAEQVASRD